MTERISDLKQRLVVSRKQDGRCCYDPQAKRELIEAGLQPGVSVAKLALMHGINANLLRKWIGKHLGQSYAASSVQRTAERPAAFIPVVPVSANHSPLTSPALAVQLPNGVRLEWLALPADQLAQVLHLLSTLPCSDSIPG